MQDVFRTIYPNDFGFTRFDNKTKTRIDLIYVSAQIEAKDYRTDALINSDHLVVSCTVVVDKVKLTNVWKLNTSWLKNEHLLKQLEMKLNE